MVLINDKKYSCATCVKGHRSSSCTHTDRPLFEVKKKGRPISQCEHCRLLRTTKQLHVKCLCVDRGAPPPPSATRMLLDDTRKGVPGTVPTFPNGLKDVHAMSDAADALNSLFGRGKVKAETSAMRVNTLLNPCRCQAGYQCRCRAGPSRPQLILPKLSSNSSRTPSEGYLSSTEEGASQASSLSRNGSSRRPSKSSPSNASSSSTPIEHRKGMTLPPVPAHLDDAIQGISPLHHSHPAHVDPRVHKTQLFSPYRTSQPSSRHKEGRISRTPSQSQGSAPPLVSRVSSTSSHTPSENEFLYLDSPLQSLDLPVLRSVTAANAQVPLPSITFPLNEPIQMQGCTCSDDCACPGCAIHPQSSTSAEQKDNCCDPSTPHASVDPQRKTPSTPGTPHAGPCPESCNSCFDCSRKFEAPMETESIMELMSLAAAAMPHPNAGKLAVDMGSTLAADPINLMNASGPVRSMNLQQASAAADEDQSLPPLFDMPNVQSSRCCGGRCQCLVGECSCMDDCCGCCITCLCAPEVEPSSSSQSSVSGKAAVSGCCGGDQGGAPLAATWAPDTGEPQIKEEENEDEDPNDLTIDRFETIQPETSGDGRARFDRAKQDMGFAGDSFFGADAATWAAGVAERSSPASRGEEARGINFFDFPAMSSSGSYAGSYVGSEDDGDFALGQEGSFADSLEAQLEALGLPWVLSDGDGELPDDTDGEAVPNGSSSHHREGTT